MKPRLVEIGTFQEIIRTSAANNVAVFFYGSENVLLFGNENVLDQVVDEMIYALGYVPRYIRKESISDQDKLERKLDIAMNFSVVNE